MVELKRRVINTGMDSNAFLDAGFISCAMIRRRINTVNGFESATRNGEYSTQKVRATLKPLFIYVLAGFLNASTITTLAYVSGFVSLLGSRLQEEMVLFGAAPSCLVFSWLGIKLSRQKNGLFKAWLIGSTFTGLFVIWLRQGPVDLDFISALLSFLITASTAAITATVFHYSRIEFRLPWRSIAAAITVACLTLTITATYALHEQTFSVPRELLYSEGSLLVGLVLYLVLQGFKGKPSVSETANEAHSDSAPATGRFAKEAPHVKQKSNSAKTQNSSFNDKRKSLAAYALLCCLLLFLSLNTVSAAGPGTATPIKHLVIVMMENHSFDNVFGVYPTDNLSRPSSLESSIQVPLNLVSNRATVPAGIRAVPNGTFSTLDPVEGYLAYHADWNRGKLNGFLASSGQQSLSYFTSSQLAVEWDWAELYSLGDMYFASYLSETAPNRLMSLAGYTPVINDHGPPPYVPFSESIMGELTAYRVSWEYFVMDPARGDYPLNYFNGLNTNPTAGRIGSWSQFKEEAESGTLPSVSWVMPVGGGAQGYSQGPPYNVTQGEIWLLGVVDSVMRGPDWNTSAIFVTYDEGGGYYDQVPPPTLDGVQLGFRVPFIVISPYAKEDYVSSTVLNHGSLIAFVDYNWRLPALNRFVDDSNIPLDVFYFNGPQGGYTERPPYPLNSSAEFPVQPQIPFSQLPYSRTGSSNLTLSNLGSSVYLDADRAYTPLYYSNTALCLVLIISMILTVLALQRLTSTWL
jgi:phospholipase C